MGLNTVLRYRAACDVCMWVYSTVYERVYRGCTVCVTGVHNAESDKEVRHECVTERLLRLSPAVGNDGTRPHTYRPHTASSFSGYISTDSDCDWQLVSQSITSVCVGVCACLQQGYLVSTRTMYLLGHLSLWRHHSLYGQSLCEVLACKPHSGRSQCWWTNICIDLISYCSYLN